MLVVKHMHQEWACMEPNLLPYYCLGLKYWSHLEDRLHIPVACMQHVPRELNDLADAQSKLAAYGDTKTTWFLPLPFSPTKAVHIFVSFDGASLHNPGLGGAGVVIAAYVNGRKHIICTCSVYLCENCSNNLAEYQGFIYSMHALHCLCAFICHD